MKEQKPLILSIMLFRIYCDRMKQRVNGVFRLQLTMGILVVLKALLCY